MARVATRAKTRRRQAAPLAFPVVSSQEPIAPLEVVKTWEAQMAIDGEGLEKLRSKKKKAEEGEKK